VSIEETIAAAVAMVVRAELEPILAALEDLQRRLPAQLGDVASVCAATGLSPASVRRRIRDGSFPTVKVGARRLVDLAALRPVAPAEIAALARKARGG
jgi:hypothetical protein